MSDHPPSDKSESKISHWLKSLRRRHGHNGNDSLREALEEYIDEMDEEEEENAHVASHERALLTNILKLRDMSVQDVMIPRADIVALAQDSTMEDLQSLLSEKQYSRLPVYDDSMDDIIGSVHIKDILAHIVAGKKVDLKSMLRTLPIVSPTMEVLDLLLYMREGKKHMALVIDEFGGTDGLVTINDVIEAIVGEVDDEFDNDADPELIEKPDGTFLADARVDIEDLEERVGEFLTEAEREDIDTLGGLVFAIAGRVPARGEVLTHDKSGLVIEIIDADPRRVNLVRLKPKMMAQAAE